MLNAPLYSFGWRYYYSTPVTMHYSILISACGGSYANAFCACELPSCDACASYRLAFSKIFNGL